MSDLELLTRLAVALASGSLIGFERGWQQREMPEGERVAGFRTFGLAGLFGAASAVAAADNPALVAAMALALGAVAGIGYYRISRGEHQRSATGVIALMVTFVLGAMAGEGYLAPAAATAVMVTLLLGFKPELHRLLRSIDREELLGTVRLALISVVVLPILPDRGFGPWESLNPYRIWWMVVLVAAVSYVGYFANRIWGHARGTMLTGLFGGIVSSTAVTLSLSRRVTDTTSGGAPAAGIVVASSMMFLRLLAIIAPVAAPLARALAPAMVAAAGVGFAAAGMLWLRSGRERAGREMPLPNPLELRPAIQFGLLLAAILVASRAVGGWLGPRGLYALAAAAGIADVDAISLSVAAMSRDGRLEIDPAAAAVLVAAAVNTAVKCAIAFALGGRRLGARVLLALAAAGSAAGSAFAW